jgi:hypothetical protein
MIINIYYNNNIRNLKMEEKCIHYNINMELSNEKEGAYHIDINTFNNNQKNKIYNINNDRKLELTKTYYAITDIKGQCNNITEQWQKWFTTSYYFLGNRDGRYNELAKNTISYDIPSGCFKECKDDFIINNIYKCENKKTFEYGKYKNFLPHDPLAIICIIGSHFKKDFIHKKDNIKGNYYYTLDHLLYDGINENITDVDKKDKENLIIKNKFVNISSDIRANLLATINNYVKINNYVDYNPVRTITTDIEKAYDRLKKYIDYLFKENEKNREKIIRAIKKDIEGFYNLFDKRDELYIKYLNDFNSEKKKYNLLYASSLVSLENYDKIVEQIKADSSSSDDIKKYIIYLFRYCRAACFSKNSIFAERLKLYGIYDTLDDKEVLLDIQMDDKDDKIDQTQSGKKNDDKIYKVMPVKLDTEPINIFDEYTYIFKLYKSFLIVYPTVFTIILSVLFAALILYIINIISNHQISKIINYAYAYILYWILLFTYIFVLNPIFIWIIRMLKWFLYDGDYFSGAFQQFMDFLSGKFNILKVLGKAIGYSISFIIILVLLIYIFVTMTIDEILMIIPNILIKILYLLYMIIIYLLKLLFTFKPFDIMVICFFIYSLIVYYYILYLFNYEQILNSFNVNIDESIGKEHANGDYSIIHTYYNEKGCRIIWDRVELIKYWYLLGRYNDAYTLVKEKSE